MKRMFFALVLVFLGAIGVCAQERMDADQAGGFWSQVLNSKGVPASAGAAKIDGATVEVADDSSGKSTVIFRVSSVKHGDCFGFGLMIESEGVFKPLASYIITQNADSWSVEVCKASGDKSPSGLIRLQVVRVAPGGEVSCLSVDI